MRYLPLLIILFFLAAVNASETNLVGKVVSVADGDTITILVDKAQHKIRLASIDCPEKAQAFGNKAKQAISKLIFGKTVSVQKVTVDRYQRIVGNVYFDDLYVNAWLIEQGYAWLYRKYSKDPQLLAMEEEARNNKRGLWADHKPIPPWEWRQLMREGKSLVR